MMKLFFIFLFLSFTYQFDTQSQEIVESVKNSDSGPKCEDGKKCRKHDVVKNIAFCKAAQLEQQMNLVTDNRYSIFYQETTFKSEVETGWSKFLFQVTSPFITEASHSVKICVPTKKQIKAWISSYCPNDPCGPWVEDENTQCGGSTRFLQPRFIENDKILLKSQKVDPESCKKNLKNLRKNPQKLWLR